MHLFVGFKKHKGVEAFLIISWSKCFISFTHSPMASSSLESSILANNSSSPTTSATTNFSRRSATYTASTFAAFEYGSNYEYHGSYNTKGDEENNDGAENDEESPPSSRITFDDLDELLEGLNEEELKELSIIDPDVN